MGIKEMLATNSYYNIQQVLLIKADAMLNKDSTVQGLMYETTGTAK